MVKKLRSRTLSVWANAQRVGLWHWPTRGPMTFTYDMDWMASDLGRPLSLSLPYTVGGTLQGESVHNFFDNLLPDSSIIRKRLASRFRTDADHAFELLAAIGRDCVGAIQILGEHEQPVEVTRIVASAMSHRCMT
jgi:serine/threonine-protein kinase HipA